MLRETAQAVESDTEPKLTKVLRGDETGRRKWEPGAGGWRPGGSESTRTIQGLRHTLARRHAAVASTYVEKTQRGSHVCPGAARLNETTNKAFAPQELPRLCQKRPRSNSEKPTHVSACESEQTAARVGTRCWSGRRPGGSVLALMDRGHKHTLACRPAARTLATMCNADGPHYSSGPARENGCARDGNDLSVPKSQVHQS